MRRRRHYLFYIYALVYGLMIVSLPSCLSYASLERGKVATLFCLGDDEWLKTGVYYMQHSRES